MILLVDNYDSFTYNLVQLVGEITPDIRVVRNDALTAREIRSLSPSHLILSPGPGYPKDAGICEEAVRELAGELPILGVCLGHQAICEAYGADIAHARRLMHGKQCAINLSPSPLFRGLGQRITGARYHSLVAKNESMPACLETIAADDLGEIMAVSHSEHRVYGLQFHPESVLTPEGRVIVKNFIDMEGGKHD